MKVSEKLKSSNLKVEKKKEGKSKVWLTVLALVVLIAGALAVRYIITNLNEYEWAMSKVWKAGFVEKQVSVDADSVLNYAEGPDNGGPALLLLHGQAADWTSYAKNLPTLSKYYHIFAVDYYGQGKSSRNVAKYSANAIGEDLKWFIENVIKEKAVVSGHSSGGLLTVWLAANAPEDVLGIVAEDPPLFTTEPDRMKSAFNWNDLSAACDSFLKQSDETDFTLWYFERQYWLRFLPEGGQNALIDMAQKSRQAHLNERLKLSVLSTSTFFVMDEYDPRFGETFYNGSWNDGFDHAEALSKVKCPSVLIHCSFDYKDGILMGAMDNKDAERANSLMADSTLVDIPCAHAAHWLKPEKFNKVLIDFLDRIK